MAKKETTVEQLNYLRGVGKLALTKDLNGVTTAKLTVRGENISFDFAYRSQYGTQEALEQLCKRVRTDGDVVTAILNTNKKEETV